jgi:hypothetical protein
VKRKLSEYLTFEPKSIKLIPNHINYIYLFEFRCFHAISDLITLDLRRFASSIERRGSPNSTRYHGPEATAKLDISLCWAINSEGNNCLIHHVSLGFW